MAEFQVRVYLAPIKPGNLQVNLPERNVLLDKGKRSIEAVPDFKEVRSYFCNGDLSFAPKIFHFKRRGFRPNYFDNALVCLEKLD
ncbi:MAG: hypothetical protein F6K48_35205 [Okeania sp. SIO3H1]|nr:hypothetical protein [Okeania sp. SIO3H1]